MANTNYNPYKFKIEGVDDKFSLLSFKGVSKISSPFEYRISVLSESGTQDMNSFMLKQCTLTLEPNDIKDGNLYISGLCAEVKAHSIKGKQINYVLTVVPNLYKTSLNQNSFVYQNISTRELIEKILNRNSISSQFYEIKLADNAFDEPIEYICQYNESDFNFLSRWMEQLGIYYYFEFDDGLDKLIITDSSLTHESLKKSPFAYRESNELVSGEGIERLSVAYKAIPGTYKNDNFAYEFNNMTNSAEGKVTKHSLFEISSFGGNANIQKLFAKFSSVESQRIRTNGVAVEGSGSVREFRPGHLFGVQNNPIADGDGTYLITELYTEGEQNSIFKAQKSEPLYKNRFKAIPSDNQFRPEKITKKPVFSGFLSATIDGEGEKTPFIDSYGRYKVKMPFDSSDTQGGKASCWIRMMQPSAANSDRGFHISLLKGDEVLLAFLEGDVDRPVIAGAINSREGVVTDQNIMQDRMKMLGGMEVIYDNTEGKESVYHISKDKKVMIGYGNLPNK